MSNPVSRDLGALVAYLHARAQDPFDWATNSCVHFAAGAVAAQTGRNVLSGLPGWRTERGARRVLRRLGGLEAATGALLTPTPPALARRGDIAGVLGEGGEPALMVVEGDTLVGPHAHGVRRVARVRMIRAWSAE